jgi:hypothetical protein
LRRQAQHVSASAIKAFFVIDAPARLPDRAGAARPNVIALAADTRGPRCTTHAGKPETFLIVIKCTGRGHALNRLVPFTDNKD